MRDCTVHGCSKADIILLSFYHFDNHIYNADNWSVIVTQFTVWMHDEVYESGQRFAMAIIPFWFSRNFLG